MRYRLRELGLEVRSEHAAKPTAARSQFLLNWIARRSRVRLAVDYGCGRLRYSLPLCSIAKKVIAVDSREQLEKLQTVNGIRTTVLDFVRQNRKIRVLDVEDFTASEFSADLVICINVLSAIPHEVERHRVASRVASHLNSSGLCLFSVQHQNSDFNRVRRTGHARPYKDGYIIDMGKWVSFYGLLTREYIAHLVRRAGLQVESAFINGQSTYVIARHRKTSKTCL
jgi:predicted TPR repeat methyltransferase